MSISYCRGPRRLRDDEYEEDGRAQQEVKDGTELRVRTRDYPVSQIVVSVLGCVAEEGEGHEVPAQDGILVERNQRGRAEREHPVLRRLVPAEPRATPWRTPYGQWPCDPYA
jgi:hypothetical protein